ncbi:MAG: YdcF family protein, partial [Mycobacteriaceae bacterium]
MKFNRFVGLAGISAVIVAGAATGAGTAAASPETVVNGILSTVGGCQSTVTELVRTCTDLEILTPEVPLMLVLNPFTTHIVVLGAGL